MTEELVHYLVEGAVATLVLDSQHNRNALSRQLVGELLDGLARAEADEQVRVVVVRAAGRVFCSGADLSEAHGTGMEEGARTLVELQRRIVSLATPVVVRAHGAVRAGGTGIVAAADVAVAANDATFAFTEVRLALAPAAISLTVLPRLTDRAAAWMFLTGETFSGEEAARHALVTRAVPEEQLDDEVAAIAAALAQGHPQGLRETKALLARPVLDDIDARGDELARLSARLFGSDEAREAMQAFLTRRR